MKTVVSIAGSDSSGGAGIQADLKTMIMNGVYGMTVITAITAQNTTGVRSVLEIPPEMIADQIHAVWEDIPPDAVKIGMIPSAAAGTCIADALEQLRPAHLVVDPVMVATSGAALSDSGSVEVLRNRLLPLAEIMTPNIPEAQVLSGLTIRSREDMKQAARLLQRTFGGAVLVKGGHAVEDASDVLCTGETLVCLEGERIPNPNTHGTGCTLSSAIASQLAKGESIETAVRLAKAYISDALRVMMDLGKGSGPLCHHFALLTPSDDREKNPQKGESI